MSLTVGSSSTQFSQRCALGVSQSIEFARISACDREAIQNLCIMQDGGGRRRPRRRQVDLISPRRGLRDRRQGAAQFQAQMLIVQEALPVARVDLQVQCCAVVPGKIEARIARGMYFVNLAGARRGGGYAVNTNRGQFRALDATLDSSFADIRVALKHDPSNLAAYWVLQRAAGFHGQADVLPTYNRALRLSPASFVTRWLAITTLAPRWGGTYESMDRVAGQAQQFASANPELRTLQGFIDWDEADAAWQSNDAERAISHAKASTSYGESYTLCLKAARILWYYDREPEALPFARCAVARRNASADGHLTLGRVLYGLAQRDPADWTAYYSRARESALLAYQLDSSDDQVSKFSRQFSTAP